MRVFGSLACLFLLGTPSTALAVGSCNLNYEAGFSSRIGTVGEGVGTKIKVPGTKTTKAVLKESSEKPGSFELEVSWFSGFALFELALLERRKVEIPDAVRILSVTSYEEQGIRERGVDAGHQRSHIVVETATGIDLVTVSSEYSSKPKRRAYSFRELLNMDALDVVNGSNPPASWARTTEVAVHPLELRNRVRGGNLDMFVLENAAGTFHLFKVLEMGQLVKTSALELPPGVEYIVHSKETNESYSGFGVFWANGTNVAAARGSSDGFRSYPSVIASERGENVESLRLDFSNIARHDTDLFGVPTVSVTARFESGREESTPIHRQSSSEPTFIVQ